MEFPDVSWPSRPREGPSGIRTDHCSGSVHLGPFGSIPGRVDIGRAAGTLAAVELVVNGEPKVLPDGTTVSGLLVSLGLEGVLVAVERNAEIVPRATHSSTPLNDGDVVEVVHFVGGG